AWGRNAPISPSGSAAGRRRAFRLTFTSIGSPTGGESSTHPRPTRRWSNLSKCSPAATGWRSTSCSCHLGSTSARGSCRSARPVRCWRIAGRWEWGNIAESPLAFSTRRCWAGTIRRVVEEKQNEAVLRVGVIGCGRMGRLHARVYSEMLQVRLVGVHDAAGDKADAVADSFECRSFDRAEALIDNVDAVTIAVPTAAHVQYAEAALGRSVSCLIEKPLAKTVAEARQIAEAARKSSAVAMVGHIERFNPVMRAMGRLHIRPQFIEVVRISPMTFRSIDVGVVLDMMIHDIDIVHRLAGS